MPAKGLAGRTKSEAARQRKDPMQNLKPFTKENAAEMGRKGGAASQKVQKKKKSPECRASYGCAGIDRMWGRTV